MCETGNTDPEAGKLSKTRAQASRQAPVVTTSSTSKI